MQNFSDYTEIIEKLARDGDNADAIKSIDRIYEKFDSLDEITKYNLKMLKANCLIKIKQFTPAFEILENIDPWDEDANVATMKMRCLNKNKELPRAYQIMQNIMENESIEWKENIDFLLESSTTFLSTQSLDHHHTWDECKFVLDTFLYPAMQKNSKNTKLLTQISEMLSVMASEAPTGEDVEEIMNNSFNYLQEAESTLSVGNLENNASLSYALYMHYLVRADLENSDKFKNVDWKSSALEYLKNSIKLDPGFGTGHLDWLVKSELEIDIGDQKEAFYSAITALNLYHPDDIDVIEVEEYERIIAKFEDTEKRSQLYELFEKKKQVISELQKMQDAEQIIQENEEKVEREVFQKEVVAYIKKLDEEDPTPQEIHECPVLGTRLQYSLWRDFKCPAIHGCGFEYKVRIDDADGKEITDEEERKKILDKSNRPNFTEDEKKRFKS